MSLKSGSAVLLVDIQNDFTLAGSGSLPTLKSESDYVSQVIRACTRLKASGLPLIATQDWHPPDHVSFASNHPGSAPFESVILEDGRKQTLWPEHCIRDTKGAELLVPHSLVDHVIQKGSHPLYDSYSGFHDDGSHATGLSPLLVRLGIQRLIIFGLATDYCVLATAADGRKAGYEVVVISSLCRPVAELTEQSSLRKMEEYGIRIEEHLPLL